LQVVFRMSAFCTDTRCQTMFATDQHQCQRASFKTATRRYRSSSVFWIRSCYDIINRLRRITTISATDHIGHSLYHIGHKQLQRLRIGLPPTNVLWN